MKKKYANLFPRVKAAIIDGIVLIVLMYLATWILDAIGEVPNYARIVVFIFVFLLYEPILVAYFGASVGHFFNDIMVKRESNEAKNIILPKAIFRFVFKFFLGWVSLLTIRSDKKGKAIHDFVGGSVVLKYRIHKSN
ncbi:RDD family protein [Seonamhaeicola sp.]|uniref:RDD family protein n=1 Tax=Seonamhaeicola sp. TaxID=1912245 RepID=UPI00261D26BB|nr:RDD family protein [Seonamhaeicola sp.]